MTPLRGGCRSVESQIEIEKHRPAVPRQAVDRLRAAVGAGPRGDAHTTSAAGKELLEGALRGGRHGDRPLIPPRRHEHAVAPAAGRSLELEVAVEIGDRAERCRRHGLVEGGKLRRQPTDVGFIRAPRLSVGSRLPERRQAPHPLLLLRAGEGIAAALEDPVQGVVVAGADGIELVIVAAGAAEAQAHHRCPEGVDGVLDREVVVFLRIEAEAAGDGKKPGRHDALVTGLWGPRRGADVAGDLVAEKLVVGEIAVEGVDAVVAVAPGDRDGIVGRFAGGVGVADDVEPMPGPLLAVGRRSEEPLDDRIEGARRRIGDEGLDLRRRRRQTGEIERRPADERAPIGAGKGHDRCLLLAGADEAVDRRLAPGFIGHGRKWRISHRRKRPVPFDLERRSRCGPQCVGADPALKGRYLFGAEGLVELGGHRRDVVVAGDRLDEEAFGRIPRHDRRPGITAADEGRARIDAQPPRDALSSMAAEAGVDKHRTDRGFEQGVVGRRDSRGDRCERHEARKK